VAGRAILAACAGLLFVLAGPAAPAAAHANLVGSDPAEGAILDAPPGQVVLSFSEPVRLVADRIAVIGPDGDPVHDGEPRVDGADVVIPIGDGGGAIGTYLVSYRVVSQDSHPIAGAVTYSVGAPSEVPDVPVELDVADPAVGVAVSVNKYLGYAGLVLVVGPALLLATLWPRRLSRRGPSRLVWAGLGLVGLSTVAGVLLQAPYTTGGRLLEFDADSVRSVFASSYGTAQVVRFGVLVSVAMLLRPVLAGRASRSDRLLVAGLGVVGLGTWPFAGHPVASPIPALSVLANTVHLAAVAFWLGGLVLLAGFLLRLANERELAVILPEWSRWAAAAVAALMLAGLVMAVMEIGPPHALWTTRYGQLLLVKLGLVAVVIAVAGYSRRLVRQRLGPTRPRAMRIAVGTEALVLAGVLVLSSLLVQTTPGRTAVEQESSPTASDYAATLTSELYALQVLVEPGERGSNTVHLTAYTPQGEPQPVAEWQVTAELPAAGLGPIDVPVLELTDNHALGEAALPVAGDWEFRFTIRVSEVDQASVEMTVPIR
jgi:copper transport protein